MTIFISLGIFLSLILLIEGGYYFYHQFVSPQQRNMKRRLRGSGKRAPEKENTPEQSLLRKRKLSEVAWIQELLSSASNLGGLEKLLQQANSQMPMGVFFLMSGCLGMVGCLVGAYKDWGLSVALGLGVMASLLPWLFIRIKRKRRFAEFQRLLPEGLDLMARALRAGHAFSVGMKMVGDEFPDPIGPEFARTVEEISFGIDTPEALRNLTGRVDCVDLKFFVTALVVQRETGGNLAEIIEAISRLIRQRYELFGRIKSLSAEGRLSGYILFALPFVMAGVLFYLNEEYMSLLFEDPVGHMMVVGAGLLMCLGAFVMRNMCQIKV
jgi:tight adherence protein B